MYNDSNRTRHAYVYFCSYAQNGGTFHFSGDFMHTYPKKILSIQDQIQTYIDAGMIVPSQEEMKETLESVGYYRLRGYSYHLYNKTKKRYLLGTRFVDIVALYQFDKELSTILFKTITTIEIALRVRLIESLLIYGDPLILNDPTVFEDKQNYWKNLSSISSEISRSTDLFIEHNFDNHNGQIPIWAAVEIMSFGTLSKIIKNLKTGNDSAYLILARHYKFKSINGKLINPDKKTLSSWIQSVSVLRNLCAHNSRIYNRAIITRPKLTQIDKMDPQPRFNGLYQILLAMKYLRPTDKIWNDFVYELQNLLKKYSDVVELARLNFPPNWQAHFTL